MSGSVSLLLLMSPRVGGSLLRLLLPRMEDRIQHSPKPWLKTLK